MNGAPLKFSYCMRKSQQCTCIVEDGTLWGHVVRVP